jgi:hypothetical protein
MIEVSPETACMFYVGSLILLLLVIWLRYSHKANKRNLVKFTTVRAVCEYCGASYLVESVTPFHRCPHCQCLNKAPPSEK